MPTFQYKAVDRSGKIVTGFNDAENKQELFKSLKKGGLTPINAEESKKIEKAPKKDNKKQNVGVEDTFFSKLFSGDFTDIGQVDIVPEKITSKDLSVFCRQGYTMLNAGMNIISTLQVLSVQIENKRLRTATGKVLIELQKGYPLSTCIRLYPKVFPTLFVNMVEAGELTGNLDGVLNSLAKYYENDHQTQARIKKATIYPKAVAVIAIIVVTLLLMFVVPTFTEMFESSDTPLPPMTVNLIAMSDFVARFWYLIFAFMFAVMFAISQIKHYDKSKYYYDFVLNKLPIFGPSIVKITTARFSRTTATLLNSGIPIISALKSSAQVSGNALIVKGIDDITDEIRAGQSLSYMLGQLDYFPPMMISMVNIGEESGDIVSLLDKTADFYEDEMKEAIDTLTGLIEPIMICFLAVVVGYVVIAILLPVLDMGKTIY